MAEHESHRSRVSNDPESVTWAAERGYEILLEEGPGEFATRSLEYASHRSARQLTDTQRLRLRLLERQIRRLVSGSVVSDPLSYIYVRPEDVQYVTPASRHSDQKNSDPDDLRQCIFDLPYGIFTPEKRFGSILDGDWDRKETAFEDVFIYRAFEEHFVNGVPWEETRYVERVAEFFDERKTLKGHDSFEEFKAKRLPFLDRLYEQIASGSYRLQFERGGSIFDELTVNIGRDGEIYFNSNGAHRLSMSKLAGVDEIPALVIVRHAAWHDCRLRVRESKVNPESLPVPSEYLTHPDIRKVL